MTKNSCVGADLGALRQHLRSNINNLAEHLLGQPNKALSAKRELRWGAKGSLRVHISGPKTGGWTDFEAGEKGDPFGLIRYVRRCDFAEAVRWAVGWAGIDTGSDVTPESEAERHARLSRRNRARDQADRKADADRSRRIRIAQFIAGHAIKVEAESVGDRYLTQTRGVPRPAGGWPDAVRFLDAWSDQLSAIAFIATDASGKICGLQRVSLDKHGRKISKKSRGAFAETGAVVRLPGLSDGPLLIAEGPETGLSVWAATGFETWIAVGGLSRLNPPQGRRVVICRDDDPEDSPADKALGRAVEKWRLAETDIVLAQPWPERRSNRSDFNDLIQSGGKDAVLGRIEAALYPSLPPDIRRRVSVKEGRQQTRAAVEHFFQTVRGGADNSVAMGIRVEVGIGKSAATREAVARLLTDMRAKGDYRTIVFCVPTHVLGSEAISDFMAMPLSHGFVAVQWRGRTAEDPEHLGRTMCTNLDRVQAAQISGADVESSCCRREMEDGTVVTCPFFKRCGYQRQKHQKQPDVIFIAHEAVFSAKPALVGEPAALIFDESFWQAGIEGADGGIVLTLEMLGLAPSLTGIEGQRQRFLRNSALDVMRVQMDGPLTRDEFLTAGISKEMAAEAHGLEWRLHTPPDLNPAMELEQFKAAERASEPNRTARRLARFWKALAALLEDEGPERSGWAELDIQHLSQGDIRIIRMKARKTIKEGWKAPCLMIDANFQVDLARHFFPNVEVIADVAVTSPHQRVVQIDGRSNSKRRLIDDTGASDVENKRRAKHRLEIAGTIHKIARGYPGSGLVVSQLAVEKWLAEHAALPASIDLAHFNAIAGRDMWGPKQGQVGVDFLIVIGRVMPKPADVEAMAEALSGRAVERIKGSFPRVQTTRENSGGYAIGAEAPRHPDPLCETIRAQICEGEIIQAIGRARGVNRKTENPVDIYVLTDMPISLPVDRLVPATALDPSPVDEMLTAGGIAYLSGACASQVYWRKWRTPSGAKSALGRDKKSGAKPYVLIKKGFAPNLCQVEFQLAGQGNRLVTAVVDMSKIADPRTHIEAIFGALVAFKLVEDPPDTAPASVVLPSGVSAPPKSLQPPSARTAPPSAPFWMRTIDLPPAPDWTPPASMVQPIRLWRLAPTNQPEGLNS